MNIVNYPRQALASLIGSVFSSSQRANTRMYRLVRWIDPTPKMVSSFQARPTAKALNQRTVVLQKTRTAVTNLTNHKPDLLKGKNHLTPVVMNMIRNDQRSEARMLLQDYLEQFPLADTSEGKPMKTRDHEYSQLRATLQSDRTMRRHGESHCAHALEELEEAYENLCHKDSSHYETSSDAVIDAWVRIYSKAEQEAAKLTKITPDTLPAAMVKLIKKGKMPVARKLAERIMAEAPENQRNGIYDTLNNELQYSTSLYKRRYAKTSELKQEAVRSAAYAHGYLKNQVPYPELDPQSYNPDNSENPEA